VRLIIDLLYLISLIVTAGVTCNAENGIMRDRTPHPVIPLESYRTVDLGNLSARPKDFTWTQIHVEVRYHGLERGTGYTRLICGEATGKEPGNLLFTITDTTQTNNEFLRRLQRGDSLDLYCMVEATLSSGMTVVMVEKIFVQDNAIGE
jgi:hypothetical protein